MTAKHPSNATVLCVVEDVSTEQLDAFGVQLDQQSMQNLGATIGDVVSIAGGRRTVAKICCAKSSPSIRSIGLSPTLRANARATAGEKVEIAMLQPALARQVLLEPTNGLSVADFPREPYSWKHFAKRFNRNRHNGTTGTMVTANGCFLGLPMVKGDQIILNNNGRLLQCTVAKTDPNGPVMVDASTEVLVMEKDPNAPRMEGYDDVGGLNKEITKVREMVELPLLYPEIFDQLGVTPPRGVLLYGPPGCGKTLIARAVAQESRVPFFYLNGPEIIQKHYGESEERLREIFAEAQKYPAAIIFMDEIDAIAPNRETVLGEVEKRVVSQLLALMDGVNSRGQVIIIAATNLPNSIDPALRRPGRLDREIRINPPDKEGRLEILSIHTRRMPLHSSVELERLAEITHGFIGADLAALCREAAMCCAQDERRNWERFSMQERITGTMRVRMDHFELALGEIEISATRQVITEVSDISWEAVGGLDDVKQLLRETIEWPLFYSKRYEAVGVRAPKGILLTGPSGTGKTLVAKALGAHSEVNFITVKGPELLSKWVGDSERGIRDVFKRARQSAPSIVFFDEIDAIIPARGNGDGNDILSNRMAGQFLLELDSIDPRHTVVVLGATSRPDLLDKSLLRPGRFDYIVEFPLPDARSRAAILDVHSKGRHLSADVSLVHLASLTEGMTGAELEALCHRAAMLAIRESIELYSEADFPPIELTGGHFLEALKYFRN